jgi:hypothetical protein
MKSAKYLMLLTIILACNGQTLLDEMEAVVPIYKTGKVLQTKNLPDENMSIIQYELDATNVTENSLINFYKSSMTPKGWEIKKLEKFSGNGSVFSFSKKESPLLSVQIITRGIKQNGKIKVVLNFSRETV